MLTVGANNRRAPLERASFASAVPISPTRSMFHVAPNAIPTGKAAAETPPTKAPPPRAPFGPSLTLIDGMPSRSIGTVVQKSLPARSETCSPTVIASARAVILDSDTLCSQGIGNEFTGLEALAGLAFEKRRSRRRCHGL